MKKTKDNLGVYPITSWWEKSWIILSSLSVSLRYSLMAFGLMCVGAASRTRINAYTRAWSKRLLEIVQARYHIDNPHAVSWQPNRTYLLMSNHNSLYDIPLIFLSLPGSIRMIAKKELLQIPIWGWALRLTEFIPVSRENPKKAIESLKKAEAKMLSGIIPWVSPEGTRSRTGQLGPLKKGGFWLAMKTEAIIIPIGIKGADTILPPKSLEFHRGASIQIRIGEPIDTRLYSADDMKSLMEKVSNTLIELTR